VTRRSGLCVLLVCLAWPVAGSGATWASEQSARGEVAAGNTGDPMASAHGALKSAPGVRRVEDWIFDETPGLVFETAHYRVHTTLLDPLVVSSLPALLESAYRAYRAQLHRPVESRFALPVYIFASRDQWEAFTRRFAGDAAEAYLSIQRGAYYHNGACVVYHIGIHQTRSALAHEGWHQFVHRHFALRLPSWLDEGLATQFENAEQANGRIYFSPQRNRYRLVGLRQAVQQRRLLALPDLLAMNPSQVLGYEQGLARFYAQAYALVRFLREADHGAYLGRFERMIRDGYEGRWPIDEATRQIAADRNVPISAAFNRRLSATLFRQYMGLTPEQLDARYRAWCIELAETVRIRETAP